MKPSILLKTSDAVALQYYEQSVENPKAVICLVHGMGEHCGRYGHVADFFNARGFSVIGFDQRGHGRSEGKRGHTPSYELLMESVNMLIKTAAEKYPGVPLILYGHSMGGNLVLNYAWRDGTGIKAVVGSSPYLTLAFDPPKWKTGLASLVKNILPGLQQPTGLDTAMLSHDIEVVKAYEADPLVHDQISTSFFFNVHTAGPEAIAHAADIKVPALVFHGTGDKITSHEGTRKFAENSNGKAELKLWEGLYHETHNEPEKNQVLGFVADWMEKQI
ncbi:MAG: lysophospholipase [Flavobacteriales bacterium]|nr:lysophospholipase [Flavobacteriales bacterium]